MFLRKLAAGEAPDPDAPVFLAEAQSVGYDATGRPAHNQLPDILEAYRAFEANPIEYLVEVPEIGPTLTVEEEAALAADEEAADAIDG